MRILRNHLKIMFTAVQPEALIAYINNRRQYKNKQHPFEICCGKVDRLTYQHFSRLILRELTYEEVDMRYYDMVRIMNTRGEACGGASVFALIPDYTYRVLKESDEKIVCRQEQFLNWRECYLALGQDLLVAAHLAYKSFIENRRVTDFGWSAMIGTDDRRLTQIMEKGLAENHFHLKGSTRSFDLSWLCFMNHPGRIKKFFEKSIKKADDIYEKEINNRFMENLNDTVTGGSFDNQLSWSDRLLIACWIRERLFTWLCDNKKVSKLSGQSRLFDDFIKLQKRLTYMSVSDLCNETESVRYFYGIKFEQLNGHSKCIDYAITGEVFNGLPDKCSTRALAGERAFLYNSLYQIYSRNPEEIKYFADLFYLYILIKSQFRNELIQVNKRYGFKNFMMYQDRKDLIFDDYPEYDLEAKNLSVNDSMENGNVKSLEMRIVPADSCSKQFKKILNIDKSIEFLRRGTSQKHDPEKKTDELEMPYYYVLHFPKEPDNPVNIPKHLQKDEQPSYDHISWYGTPRNKDVRVASELQAKTIAKVMECSSRLCSRIRGIDACSFEIGCRPEVFAVGFRFLTSFIPQRPQRNVLFHNSSLPKLCATYHVGEDFMDIVDGLRAIDEAVVFLELESGDRLGHALALGINPFDYYKLKGNNILLSKQDQLDNIVWLLNKSKGFNINLESALKQHLYDDAKRLLYEIYGQKFDLVDYCSSRQLRGDDPELYRNGYFDIKAYKNAMSYKGNNLTSQYDFCRLRKRYNIKELEIYRNNSRAVELYWRYHFDYAAKKRGSEVEKWSVSTSFIKAVEAIQNAMQKDIAKRNIAIECNLSSNVLIGSFDRYDEHPIFRFCPISFCDDDVLQYVSINTDDQGVFDTSLQTEYTLLACALRSIKKEDGMCRYNDDLIYNYIERIRRNGFSQSFPKSQRPY